MQHVRCMHSDKPLTCDVCGKAFSHKGNLVQHQATHTTERPFSCTSCGNTFKTKRALVVHQKKTGHQQQDERQSPGLFFKSFNCVKCGERFKHKSSLAKHEQKCNFITTPEKSSPAVGRRRQGHDASQQVGRGRVRLGHRPVPGGSGVQPTDSTSESTRLFFLISRSHTLSTRVPAKTRKKKRTSQLLSLWSLKRRRRKNQ